MAEKFSVQTADDDHSNDAPSPQRTDSSFPVSTEGDVPEITVTGTDSEISKQKAVHYDPMWPTKGEEAGRATQPLTDEGYENQHHQQHFELFAEDAASRPRVTSFLSSLLNYEGGIEPNTAGDGKKKKDLAKKDAKLGTLLGVYFPCIQNIFGVLLFIRLCWIVGVAGALQGFCIVGLCCCTTLLTAISMSAIATNGKVPGGGSYFMISRSLGPEFGGAVGILFYLGTTVAAAMYIIGAVEIFLVYICPSASIFGDIRESVNLFKNTRVYGVVLLFILMLCVFAGIRVVSKVATFSLGCVIFSIICVYVGIFISSPDRSPKVCALGDTLLRLEDVMVNGTMQCNKEPDGPLYQIFCADPESEKCNLFKYKENLTIINAIPGLASGVIKDNFLSSHYKKAGQSYADPTQTSQLKIEQPSVADITTSFMILLAIFFPSVTGIMAGSNRSGDLKNAQYSIPRGTIAAITTTSGVYLSCVIFFAAVIDGRVMRDKFGESIGGEMIVALMSGPLRWVILIGSLLSTIGAGLQSLTGAPRLLQAIAQDKVIPIISVFRRTTKSGEPLFAQLLTMGISLLGILIASVDSITPLITEFFLMCYLFVNLATVMNSLLQEPNWRPRFRAFHWSLSFLGMILCLTLMFISGWYFAIIAMLLAALIYIYIRVKGASQEWGDATLGLKMSTAKQALLSLGEKPPHTKNWRPQILVLIEHDESTKELRHTRLLDLTYQLKAGRGLTIAGTVLQGDLSERAEDVSGVREKLTQVIKSKKLKALTEVLVAGDIIEGIRHMLQVAGLGSLRHNCVMMNYPETWKANQFINGVDRIEKFVTVLRTVRHNQMAILVPKGIDRFPISKKKPMSGSIDVWWIVHDGGLLLLIGHLLQQSRIWEKCKLRLFTVVDKEEMREMTEKSINKFVYDLRLKVDNTVITMHDTDISAYTYERTVQMQNRSQFLAQLNIKTVDRNRNPQAVVDSLQMEFRRQSITNVNNGGPSSGADNAEVEETRGSSKSSSDEDLMTPQTEVSQFTFSPLVCNPNSSVAGLLGTAPTTRAKPAADLAESSVSPNMVRAMHDAVKLNELIHEHSSSAGLVIMNMPSPSRHRTGDYNFMEYLDALTEGLERVLLVRGSSREVVTIFS